VIRRLVLITLLLVTCGFGQQRGRAQSMRAEIRGGGDHGKCTIEVVVDGAADVVIRGDSAELRTLSGQEATWRRFVCNQELPLNPVDFRFTGIDGRGRQTLLKEPGRGGPAIVRIEDRKGGREGYTFDIEWRGDAGGNWQNRQGPRRDQGFRGPAGWTGRLGGELQFRGDGRGFLNRGNGPDMPVRDVLVSMNRDGGVAVQFEARGFRRVAFTGQATRVSRDTVVAELTSGGRDRDTRGSTVIYVNRAGEVERVTMNGRMEGGPFRLDWSAR
jgi:hypothetical protein